MQQSKVCAQSCLDYLLIELVQHYQKETEGPPLQVCANDTKSGAEYFQQTLYLAQILTAVSELYQLSELSIQHASLAFPSMQAAIESIGLQVGRQLAERLTRDRPPMLDQLDKIKFVCKDFWTELFRKNVDNLRTNHRGTYVLRDTQFRWLGALSQNLVSEPQRIAASELSHDYLVLPCAIIKGALRQLGLETCVSADATGLPQCDFTVTISTALTTS